MFRHEKKTKLNKTEQNRTEQNSKDKQTNTRTYNTKAKSRTKSAQENRLSISYLGENTSKNSIFMWNLWEFSELIVIPVCFDHLFKFHRSVWNRQKFIIRIYLCVAFSQSHISSVKLHRIWLVFFEIHWAQRVVYARQT